MPNSSRPAPLPLLALALSGVLHWGASSARAEESDRDAKETKAESPKEAIHETLKVTQGTVTVGGEEIAYTTTAGRLTLVDEEDEPVARMFFVAYTRDDVDAADRPVTFCFNGGPGSSSVWLHLGMLGPRKVVLPSDAGFPRPPYRLEDNPHSLLDTTDLVFIDPVSTGYSRPEENDDKSDFHGFHEDVRSVGQFVHDYLTRFGRWGSPKFVLGESYGGLRAAALTGHLQDRYRIELNGAVIISGVINFQTLRFDHGNDLPYALFFPTYAATAWYHGRLSDELQQAPVEKVVQQAEAFAFGLYTRALMAGDTLSKKRAQKVTEKFAELSGLSEDFVRGSNLRVPMSRFARELLRDEGHVVGRFDSRYTGVPPDAVGERPDHDPSGAALFGAFTGAMNVYLRDELQVEPEGVYEILSPGVHPWNYKSFQNRYVDASETFRSATATNPFLKVFVAAGYYDLATPHAAMDYTVSHLGLAPDRRSHVTTRYYEGGHMMYVHAPSLEQLHADLTAFYRSATDAE